MYLLVISSILIAIDLAISSSFSKISEKNKGFAKSNLPSALYEYSLLSSYSSGSWLKPIWILLKKVDNENVDKNLMYVKNNLIK